VYLYADENTTLLYMYDYHSGSRIQVKDFQSYPGVFSLRDPRSLVLTSPAKTAKFSKMQTKDAIADLCIAVEDVISTGTRAEDKAIQTATGSLTVANLALSVMAPEFPIPRTQGSMLEARPPKFARIQLDNLDRSNSSKGGIH